MPSLVLLGHDWNGVPSLQLLPPAIPAKRRPRLPPDAHAHRLPQLRHHLGGRSARVHHRVLHRGCQVHRAQVHDRRVDAADGRGSVLVHEERRSRLSARDDLSRGVFSECHVWRAVRLVRLFPLSSSIHPCWKNFQLTRTPSTPEVFPAPNRGTGTGIASCLNRIAGLCAPVVAVHAGGVNPKAPVYASGALILAAFVAMCCFPIETRGKERL